MSKLTQDELIEFEKVKEELKLVKVRELLLRNLIYKSFRYDKVEGVVHKSIDDSDIDIAITLNLNRNVDKIALNSLWPKLDQKEKDCFKFTPEVIVSKFKALKESGGAARVISVITEKPGLPSVVLKFE